MSTNCILAIPKFGSARVRVTELAYGMEIISYAPDGQSRAGSTFYPAKRADSDIDLALIFSSRKHYEQVNSWLQRYVDSVGNPKAKVNSPVRITLPARNFDMVAVIKNGITFGRRVGETSFGMTLSFSGARSTVAPTSTTASFFTMSRSRGKDPALTYLYPSSTQLSGTDVGWDTLADEPSGWLLEQTPDSGGPLDAVLQFPGMG